LVLRFCNLLVNFIMIFSEKMLQKRSTNVLANFKAIHPI